MVPPNKLGPDLNDKAINETQYQENLRKITLLLIKEILGPKRSYSQRDIELHLIPTQYQLADIFTKSLDEPTIKRLIVELEEVDIRVCRSFRFLDVIKSLSLEYEHVAMNLTSVERVQESQRVWFSNPSGVTHSEVGLTSFRNAVGANSRDYAQTPSIEDVRAWFPSIGYGEEIETKRTLKKAFLPPRKLKKDSSLKEHQIIQLGGQFPS
ncbi:hypothetical protein Tco_0349483 [Tanacetum coccineum]